MKMKSINVFLTCLLLLSGFAVCAIACPPPPCPNPCEYWSGEECVCHEQCCEDEDCGTGIEECLSCNLDSCTCEDDQSKCSGCCKCDYGMCEDDDSKCDPDECCIDCECWGPLCDNCHTPPADTQYECGHTPASTKCGAFWCIKNVIDTATCNYMGDTWPCDKKNCDTVADGSEDAVVQTTYFIVDPCPTAGDPVSFEWWKTVHYGCSDCTVVYWTTACQIDTCDTSHPMGEPVGLGQKYKCGCP